jgi:hypothetical protein
MEEEIVQIGVPSSVTPLFGGPIPFGIYYHKLIGDIRVKTRSNSQHSDGLFVDDIWPGSLFLTEYLLTHTFLCHNKNIVEISAGASLPSLVASKLSPKSLLVTDFPQIDILENIQECFEQNSIDQSSYQVLGYKWGEDVTILLKTLPENTFFDLMILSEVLWRDTYPQHRYVFPLPFSTFPMTKVWLSVSPFLGISWKQSQGVWVARSVSLPMKIKTVRARTDDSRKAHHLRIQFFIATLSP